MITFVAVCFAGLALVLRPFLRQSAAIQEIQDAGGLVETRPGPKWVQTILGADNCRTITLVNLADIDPSQELLGQISQLPNLEILVLGGDTITDDTLKYVPTCDSMEAVVLDSTLVTAQGIASLRNRRPNLDVCTCDRRLAKRLKETYEVVLTEINPDTVRSLKNRLPAEFAQEVIDVYAIRRDLDAFTIEQICLLRRLSRLESFGVIRKSPFFDSPTTDTKDWFREVFALPHLKHLTICIGDLEWADGLSPMPRIESLTVRTGILEQSLRLEQPFFLTDNNVVSLLRLFPNLKKLTLWNAAVTSPQEWPTAPLEELSLYGSQFDDRSLKQVASRFPKLRSLELRKTDVTDAGIPHLLPLKNLDTLLLKDTRVTEASYETLCRFPNLRRISIGAGNWNAKYGIDEDFSAVGKRYFWREDQPFQAEGVMDFSPDEFRPSAERIAEIRGRMSLGNVERFDYRSRIYFALTPIESLHVDALYIPPEITAIDCTDTYLDDVGLERICEFSQSEVVKLHHTWVTDEGIHHLLKLKNLRSIDLAETRTTAECVSVLANIPSLETIRLPATVDGDCVEELLKLPNLRYVSVRGGPLDRRLWSAKQLTLNDVEQFRRLAEVLFHRLDQDQDSVVTESDFADLVTFASLNRSDGEELQEWNSPHELLQTMLDDCLATPEGRMELRRSETHSNAIR